MHLFDIGDIFRARIYTSPIKCAQIIFGMVKRLFMISICINKQKNVKCAMAQYNVWTLWNLNVFPVRGAEAMCEWGGIEATRTLLCDFKWSFFFVVQHSNAMHLSFFCWSWKIMLCETDRAINYIFILHDHYTFKDKSLRVGNLEKNFYNWIQFLITSTFACEEVVRLRIFLDYFL